MLAWRAWWWTSAATPGGSLHEAVVFVGQWLPPATVVLELYGSAQDALDGKAMFAWQTAAVATPREIPLAFITDGATGSTA